MSDEQPATKPRPIKAWIGGAAFLIIFALLFWKGPWWIDGDHIRQNGLQPADGVIITGLRTGLIAIGAGLIAAVGLLYTHRNHQLARQQFEHTQEQFTLAQRQFDLAQAQFQQSQEQYAYEQEKDRQAAERDREGRITEQFVTAVRLLGSSSHAERLGAIYSLRQLARTSSQYHEAIAEMLESFKRERQVLIRQERRQAEDNGDGTWKIRRMGDGPEIPNVEIFQAEMEAASRG